MYDITFTVSLQFEQANALKKEDKEKTKERRLMEKNGKSFGLFCFFFSKGESTKEIRKLIAEGESIHIVGLIPTSLWLFNGSMHIKCIFSIKCTG